MNRKIERADRRYRSTKPRRPDTCPHISPRRSAWRPIRVANRVHASKPKRWYSGSDTMRRLAASALRAPHIVGPAAAIVIVIAIGVYSYLDGEAYRAAAAWAAQSRNLVDRTQALLSLLKDAESGQRGYILTGNVDYLAPYTAALPQIAAMRERLGSLATAEPGDAQRLSDLIGMRLAEMAETIAIRESAGVEAAT